MVFLVHFDCRNVFCNGYAYVSILILIPRHRHMRHHHLKPLLQETSSPHLVNDQIGVLWPIGPSVYLA